MSSQSVAFDNTAVAFAPKSDNDLRRSYLLFKVISFNGLVKLFSSLGKAALSMHLPVKGLIKATVFRQFCGGESIEECTKTIQTLSKYNVGAILDYSVEGKEREQDFERTLEQILACIDKAQNNKDIPFSVFKPTGIARLSLLEKINKNEPLTVEEIKEFKRVRNRYEKICGRAYEKGIPIFVDAEETWIQDVIDSLVREMMMKYNKNRAMIYNTIQLYRTDRIDFLKKTYEDAVANNYFLGLKLVRGAYMEKERARAMQMGYPSPILPDKAATDRAYDEALRFCVTHIDRIAICAGAHNEQSALLLIKLMQENNLPNNHPNIWFSQLYGMSDHISFNLARAGYNVCKYVPYGPVETVLPYLIRRAEENTSVKGQTGRELSLIEKELRRRKLKPVS